MKIIRGARIDQQLNEVSFRRLEQNTNAFTPPASPTARQHAVGTIRVQKLQLIPLPRGMEGDLKVESQVQSGDHAYTCIIQFDRVKYDKVDTPTNVSFQAADGDEYHIQPINLNNNNAKVQCNCLDFYYRFSSRNNNQNSLYGQPPPPYLKKTDRPSVNPRNVPGVCKHILAVVKELRTEGVVTG